MTRVRLVFGLCASAVLLGAGADADVSAARVCGWSLSASVVPRGQSVFNGVDARAHDDVWAVGVVASSDSYAEGPTLAERWDGTRWRRTPTPAGAGVFTGVSAVAANDAWVVGARGRRALIEHWDGMRWRVVASPKVVPSALMAVDARSRTDAWAVGIRASYQDVVGAPLLEHWDGRSWNVIPAPPDPAELTDVVSVGPGGQVWTRCLESPDGVHWQLRLPPQVTACDVDHAGGAVAVDAHDPSDVWVNFGVIARWDGSHWRRRPLYASDVAVAGLAVISERDVWAAGTQECCGGAYLDYLAHWDGARWTRVASAFPYDIDNGLLGISAVSANDVWAVGDAIGQAHVEHYRCPA